MIKEIEIISDSSAYRNIVEVKFNNLPKPKKVKVDLPVEAPLEKPAFESIET